MRCSPPSWVRRRSVRMHVGRMSRAQVRCRSLIWSPVVESTVEAVEDAAVLPLLELGAEGVVDAVGATTAPAHVARAESRRPGPVRSAWAVATPAGAPDFPATLPFRPDRRGQLQPAVQPRVLTAHSNLSRVMGRSRIRRPVALWTALAIAAAEPAARPRAGAAPDRRRPRGPAGRQARGREHRAADQPRTGPGGCGDDKDLRPEL